MVMTMIMIAMILFHGDFNHEGVGHYCNDDDGVPA